MILQVHNDWTICENILPEQSRAIHDVLAVDTSGLVNGPFTDKQGNHRRGLHYVHSEWSAYEARQKRFPTGLLRRVLKAVQPEQIEDHRKHRLEAVSSPEIACAQLGIEV